MEPASYSHQHMVGSSKALSEKQEAAKAVQQQLHNLCHDTRSLVNPKAQSCGALLTTVQQAKRCSSTARLVELWSNGQII